MVRTLILGLSLLLSLDLSAQVFEEDFAGGVLPSGWQPFSRSNTGTVDSSAHSVSVIDEQLVLAYGGSVRSAVAKTFPPRVGQQTLSFRFQIQNNTTRNFISLRDSNNQIVTRLSIGRIQIDPGTDANQSVAVTTQMNTNGLLPDYETVVAQSIANFKQVDFWVSILLDFDADTLAVQLDRADGSANFNVSGVPFIQASDNVNSIEIWQYYTFNQNHTITLDDFLLSSLDKSGLLLAMGQVADFLNHNNFGNQAGQYPTAQQQILNDALLIAQTVCDTANTQVELDRAAEELLTLLAVAQESLIAIDYGMITVNGEDLCQSLNIVGTDAKLSFERVLQANDLPGLINLMYTKTPLSILRIPILPAICEPIEGQADFAVYDSVILLMQAVQAVKPDVQFFASPAERDPVYANWMQEPKSGGGTSLGAKYGRHCADYFAYMNNQGFQIQYFGPTNEDGFVGASDHIDVMDGFWQHFDSALIKPLVVAPDRWSVANSINMVRDLANLGKMDYLDIIGSHHYDDDMDNQVYDVVLQRNRWKNLSAFANQHGKPIWQTEGTRFGKNGSIRGAILGMMQMWYAIEGGITGHIVYQGMNAQIVKVNAAGNIGLDEDYFVYNDFISSVLGQRMVKVKYDENIPVRIMAFRSDSSMSVFAMNYSPLIPYRNISIRLDSLTLAGPYQRIFWDEKTSREGNSSFHNFNGNTLLDSLPPNSYVAYHFPINTTTSLADKMRISSLSIVPNPLHNSFSVQGLEPQLQYTFRLIDLEGKTLRNGILTNQALNISDLPSGHYLLKVSDSKGRSTSLKLQHWK